MTDLDRTLSELARRRSGDEPIVSVYLDVRWGDERQRERATVFVRDRAREVLAHYLPESPGRAGLERTLGRAEALVAELARQALEASQAGLALFACEALGLWRPLFFRRPFRDALSADGVPHLTQLARLADHVPPAIVAAPGPDGADLLRVGLGEVEVEGSLRGPVPRRDTDVFDAGTGKPGRQYERPRNDERHQEAFEQKNRRAAAAQVTRLFDERPGSKVVLVGTSEALAAF